MLTHSTRHRHIHSPTVLPPPTLPPPLAGRTGHTYPHGHTVFLSSPCSLFTFHTHLSLNSRCYPHPALTLLSPSKVPPSLPSSPPLSTHTATLTPTLTHSQPPQQPYSHAQLFSPLTLPPSIPYCENSPLNFIKGLKDTCIIPVPHFPLTATIMPPPHSSLSTHITMPSLLPSHPHLYL